MNSIDFTQTGGFPFDESTLDFLQTNINVAAQAASLAGQLSILSGCVVTGGSASDGYVVINGEILPFVGGAIQAKIIIVQTTSGFVYHDGTSRNVKSVRVATFGDDGITTLLWANFKRNTTEGVLARLDRLERIAAPFMPVYSGGTQLNNGGMVLWKKPANTVPAGWTEVVDWRGRLPMGYNPYDSDFDMVGVAGVKDGITGGAKTHTLTKGELPSYNIAIPLRENGTASAPDSFPAATDNAGINYGVCNVAAGGNDQAHNILNPYRIVVFIEYIGV